MAEHFRFFDSANPLAPDRTYNAQEFTDYFKALVTTGVMKGTGNELKVTTNGGSMVTTIDNGIAFLLGRYYENDSALALTHEIEAVGKSRIDRVVIRMDLHPDARNVKAVIKRGVASGTPTPPTLTQTNELYEISLAQVLVVGGQTFIGPSAITDERGKDNICPWAGSKILPNFNDDALEDMVTSIENHRKNYDNPHNVTAKQILPEIDTVLYESLWYINPTIGNDDNDGQSEDTAFLTIDRLMEEIKPISLGTTKVIFSGPIPDAAFLLESLSNIRIGGYIDIDFARSILEWPVDIEGCGVPLILRNLVTQDRLHFKRCAPVELRNPTFNISGYTFYQELIYVEYGQLSVFSPTFNQAKTGVIMMSAGEASVMSVNQAKFVNCVTSSRAYQASNSLLMYNAHTITGSTPVIKTEYGGGRVFGV